MPYISLRPEEVKEMLGVLGLSDLDALFAHVPPGLMSHQFDLPSGLSQLEVERELQAAAQRNAGASEALCFLGGGAYDHYCPPVVREIMRRGEFYTAYTPYQPEIAQGVLQALFEYQTMVARLTGLEIANASLYDGATAAWEAVLLAVRQTGREKIVVDGALNPRWREMLATGAEGLGLEIAEVSSGSLSDGRDVGQLAAHVCDRTAAVMVPNPDFYGRCADMSVLEGPVHDVGALLIGIASPLSMAVLRPPGAMGCDVACGEAQDLGLSMNYGGPYLGYLACRSRLVRRVPGRLVGMTVDAKGNRAFTLTLQTREQHIRREKATSNICTNQSLCAFAAGAYLTAMGYEGIRRCAAACLKNVAALRAQLTSLPGVVTYPGTFWRECVVRMSVPADEVCREMAARGILAGIPLKAQCGDVTVKVLEKCQAEARSWREGDLLIAVTEMRSAAELTQYVSTLEKVLLEKSSAF